jgi:hypothetical protein
MFRELFLRLIHYTIALGEFAFGIWKSVQYLDFIFAKKQLAFSVEKDRKNLRKLPLHIGFVVTENEFSMTDLANLIVWSVTLGISYISVYDMNGKFSKLLPTLGTFGNAVAQHVVRTETEKAFWLLSCWGLELSDVIIFTCITF